MRRPTNAIAIMLALSLCIAPLTACGGQSQTTDAESATSEQASTGTTQLPDLSSWKTLGDALAYDDGTNSSASWDESHYLTMFDIGDSTVFVVAKMDAQTYDAYSQISAADENYEQETRDCLGGLELVSAEDVTSLRLDRGTLDTYVGKTGQDLFDDGFDFEDYWGYGGDETGVTMAKGLFAYNVTFDAHVDEEQVSDEGEGIKNATIQTIEYVGASNSALDPSTIK